jgi:hypothetical protein
MHPRKISTGETSFTCVSHRGLYDKISREDILAHAYAQCRSNKGAPGVDGQDFVDTGHRRRASSAWWKTFTR